MKIYIHFLQQWIKFIFHAAIKFQRLVGCEFKANCHMWDLGQEVELWGPFLGILTRIYASFGEPWKTPNC